MVCSVSVSQKTPSHQSCRFFATDIDERAIELARAGNYPAPIPDRCAARTFAPFSRTCAAAHHQ